MKDFLSRSESGATYRVGGRAKVEALGNGEEAVGEGGGRGGEVKTTNSRTGQGGIKVLLGRSELGGKSKVGVGQQ